MGTDEHAARGKQATSSAAGEHHLLTLSLSALGIVYGDIGTSPLYAMRECFFGEYGVEPHPANVLGVLSLITWSLVIIVSIKYLALILRADNRGEGGILALLALVHSKRKGKHYGGWLLASMGLFGAALLYGDGMITPAISVLSAVEGLQVATPFFAPYVLPITIAILAGLFLVQHHGTARVGAVFGPVTLLWLVVTGALGVRGIVRVPAILAALDPRHGLIFLAHHRGRGFFVLGAVFLVVTGCEALYADLGHFGKRPIRVTWFALVLPALLLNYFGQGALLLLDPEAAHNPFYRLAPAWALYPLVVLATAATIIASQAVISGAFSLTRQAVQLGYSPRMQIEHTSSDEIGQIYIPPVNWALMLATIGLVLGFQSSSALAAAYGVAVTTTMVITTLLFYVVASELWEWGRWTTVLVTVPFLVVDVTFFGANFLKVGHGGWFPLVIAAGVFTLMSTWKRGREILAQRLRVDALPIEHFLADIATHPPARVPGTAVFMTGNPSAVPLALLHNLKHNKILHEHVVLLAVATEDVPRVPRAERVEITSLGNGFHRIIMHYGFMEDPNIPRALGIISTDGLQFKPMETTYFLGRERLIATEKPGMALWRERLFGFMSRNAQGATAFFHIPPNRVVELGVQIEL
jgi:KUP system potassium uptake protein